MNDVWAVVVGVVLGQALLLGAAWIQRRWGRDDSRKGRADERAEAAAQALIDGLERVRALNDGNATQESTRDDAYQAEYELSHEIERQILLIPDAKVRDALRQVTLVLWYSEQVAKATGDSLQEVSFHLFAAGNEIVGSFLRGEALPKVEGNYQLEELCRYYDAAKVHDGNVNKFLGRDSDGRPLPRA